MKQRTRQGSGQRAEGNIARAFCFVIAVAVVPMALVAALVAQTGKTADVESKVDAIFAKYTPSTPGCAVGVATNGKPARRPEFSVVEDRVWDLRFKKSK